ncbi:heat shock 70 kDa protein 12A-like, partial [Saccostrea cucullata]|uniref:heat shock 70 kDa protein 12A-like n=1 Tax=Saccostrea cuccullata TaxID=36930 RepID=UPI002ED04861
GIMAFMPKVIAAVDFGGTYIGYCYTFLRESTKGLHFPEWGPHCSSKTKACVLLSPNRQFHSLGNEADRKFLELQKSGEAPAWFYCENIKKILTESQDYVTCRNKQSLAVTEVLSGVLQYFLHHLIKRCGDIAESVSPADVRWVFNLPVRARNDVMSVLKSAASKANIDTEAIYFIPEVEAIVIAAKILHQDKNIPETDQLCVCDLGGSSVSVVKLDVDENGTINMKECQYTDNFGGQGLDKQFLKFLRNVLGSHVIQAFEDYLPLQMQELMSLFELSKSNMTPEFTRKYVFGIPPLLVKRFKVFFPTFQEEEQFAPNPKFGEKVIMSQNSLTADEKIVWHFLKEPVESVTEYLQHAFENLQVPKTTTVIITGGFSKSTGS